MGGSFVTGIAAISGVLNLLGLTASLYMLQIYDRVLASGSVSTLVGLTILVAALYSFQAFLDVVRSRILLRLGERFDNRLASKVHRAVVRLPLLTRMAGDGLQPLRDLDNVRGFLSSPGPTAIFDLPWVPLYLAICFAFHAWIGILATIGAVVLILLTALTGALTQAASKETVSNAITRNALLEAARRNADVVQAMGLEKRLHTRWQSANSEYLVSNRKVGDISGGLGGLSKALRFLLQSGLLGLGAYLAIRQEVSPGVMIASSIIMGRALAPVDLAIGSWKSFIMARQSWTRLQDLLSKLGDRDQRTTLPPPQQELRLEDVYVAPPGETNPTVNGINLTVPAGSALAIIGPSGCGKSTLARAIVGVWATRRGAVRLDNATFDQWDRDELGQHIGYLPQTCDLFDGTIAQNISRFEDEPDSQAIVAAARAAGVHDLIVRFENGYDTAIGEGGSALSAGQRQRLGLARAMYRDPFLVVLDEPNSNLDAEGETALTQAIAAIRQRKGIVIVVAHRPSALSTVDLVLMMDAGRVQAFGPRDEVLSKVLKQAKPAHPQQTPASGQSATSRSVVPLRAAVTPLTDASPIPHQDTEHADR
ncbi:type I secretion system permease/ATPase [Rhizobium sp. CFBP 8762]|uniref:type I secretion system permease/ATPase n=1 Tax=Rhizobium sp. CFBP 8762 TaxID=2775279 RepID=UPI001FD0CE4B|nr:type I secretion system permease/ATPase [Rhizobium sp. CFBP 8762]